MYERLHGKCSRCDATTMLIQVYEDEAVCEHCLDSWFQQCDICGEYWEDTVSVELYGDKFVCEYCAEEMGLIE